MDRPIEMGKNMKIFISHATAYQRVTPVEESFNNPVDTGRFFPSHSYHYLIRFTNKVALVAVMEVMHIHNNMDLYSLRLT